MANVGIKANEMYANALLTLLKVKPEMTSRSIETYGDENIVRTLLESDRGLLSYDVDLNRDIVSFRFSYPNIFDSPIDNIKDIAISAGATYIRTDENNRAKITVDFQFDGIYGSVEKLRGHIIAKLFI